MRLDGRVAIVAGAGSGIGAAIAQRFAAAGAQVIAADIGRASVDALAAQVTGLTAHTCDVTDSAAVDALVAPGHCTGWRATHELARQLPNAFVQPSVGTTFRFARP